MTGPLLRSASLTHYHAVGAVGNPVYLAASQLRAAIGRRLGPEVADVFAVPQRNEDGDTLDWYAPRPGTVVPWSSATEAERAEAQRQLLDLRAQIETLGRSMEAEASPERQVFGRLLAQVMQFPDEQDVHLVDGRPVLTFWGFVRDRAAVGSDPLRNLERHMATPRLAAAPARRRWWLWLLLALLLLLLVAGLLWALRGCDGAGTSGREGPIAELFQDRRRLSGAEPEADATPAPEPVLSFPDEDAPVPADLEVPADPEVVDRVDSDPSLIDMDRRRTIIDRTADRLVIDGDIDLLDPDERTIEDTLGGYLRDDEVAADPAALDEAAALDAAGIETAEVDAPEVDAPEVDAPEVDAMGVDPDHADLIDTDVDAETIEAAAAVDAADAAATTDEALPADSDARDTAEPAAATEDTDTDSAEDADATALDGAPSPPEPESAGDADGDAGKPGDAAADRAPVDRETTAAGTDGATARAAPGPAPVRIPPRELLNSGWRTSTTLVDPKDGSPVHLSYRLKDGAGKIRLARKDGSLCESDIQGSVRDGRLLIETQDDIVCGDNTSFGRPRIDCRPQAGGAARCVGRYADGTSFPIDMERQAEAAPEAAQ